ncbi:MULTISPECIES: YheU family protein [Pasteurellaceae]|uniref:YheU family protein n=1 Tax=Pasteurella atlantica TaxID=2827233 RepID=A0AAW8CR40_9PAST|nr:YheU family protein [Pasteurella atlantica]MBR0574090.1 YheU family protein [Pasteurella atlantica]MDP8040086.1 YheU family protein [Pasteurella atlantica]MDP8042199.1 YheU family protein [Pasteurella atlantica]MDP8044394.1 YheU family protein [Pasteurella atlantica]MDP8046358.1 YheU family protein [Pasteurella atlantica]
MIIPWKSIPSETLDNILESFIMREGTDYGEVERSMEEKKECLLQLIYSEQAVIVWSELHQSLDIKDRQSFFG